MSDSTHNTEQSVAFSFHGAYTRAVDAKGRFSLPFRFRLGAEDEKYVVSKGPDGNLAVHPYSTWLSIFTRMQKTAVGEEQRRNVRIFSKNCRDVRPDSQGRVAVPTDLLTVAGIGRKVTVIGVGDYMELWNPETLEAGDAAAGEPDSAFSDLFFGGGG